ncbi:hypothetical protein [Ottowia thiooxydans]|uniref:hypothetical protein n=1 Tax=Ottowia thiooxydans TaxID=219182 RepID=UPI001B7F8AD1|nr:hypothetical protein [Ottowia thiooxydans]
MADGEIADSHRDGGEGAATVEVRDEQAAVAIRAVEGVARAVDSDALLHEGEVAAEEDVGAEDNGVAVIRAAGTIAGEGGAEFGIGRHRNRCGQRQRRKQGDRQHRSGHSVREGNATGRMPRAATRRPGFFHLLGRCGIRREHVGERHF